MCKCFLLTKENGTGPVSTLSLRFSVGSAISSGGQVVIFSHHAPNKKKQLLWFPSLMKTKASCILVLLLISLFTSEQIEEQTDSAANFHSGTWNDCSRTKKLLAETRRLAHYHMWWELSGGTHHTPPASLTAKQAVLTQLGLHLFPPLPRSFAQAFSRTASDCSRLAALDVRSYLFFCQQQNCLQYRFRIRLHINL